MISNENLFRVKVWFIFMFDVLIQKSSNCFFLPNIKFYCEALKFLHYQTIILPKLALKQHFKKFLFQKDFPWGEVTSNML